MSESKPFHKPPDPAESEPSRRRILDAALDEFAEHGLAGGRVDRIAERASVNKAMIYYHFKSKDNLYRETIADIYHTVLRDLSDRVSSRQSFEQLLRDASELYFRVFYGHPSLRRILIRELAEPDSEILAMIVSIIRDSGAPQKLLARFQERMSDGTIRALDVRHTLASFLALNIGSILMAPLITRVLGIADADTFLDERREAIVDLFLHGVKAPQ